MKNSEKLNEAIGNIDNKMIEAAYERQAEKKSRSGVWQIIGIAASFLFIAAFAVVLSRFTGRQSSVSNPSASSDETEKTVNKNDYEKFNDQGFLYNTEDGLFRFELQTYMADNELFFFTCKLKVTNVSDHDVTLHRCGSCDSFFAFDVNMTRGENSQIISYKGSLDESKKELTLKPGKSHEEYLTNSTPISEAVRTTYLQYLHDVYVDMSVSLDLDPSNNFGWHYTIMHVKGRQFVKSGDVSDTEDTDDNDHNVFVCGDQRVKGLEGFSFSTTYKDESKTWLEADGSGISTELITMSDPPTLYYKPGDTIRFSFDPELEFACFLLWKSDGMHTLMGGTDLQLHEYLERNSGEYFLTAELISYGRNIDGKREIKSITMGVKLIASGADQTETDTSETEENDITLVDISEIKEIKGYYYIETEGPDDWSSGAFGIGFRQFRKTAFISRIIPSLMPKDYVVSSTGYKGSVNKIEDAHTIEVSFIDNKNGAVEMERDSDGNIVYNRGVYNYLSIYLRKKDKDGDSIEFQKDKKYLIKGGLSAESINEKRFDNGREYTFMLEFDDYYVVYDYNNNEGGENGLNCKDLYDIASSTPYIKENGYHVSDETDTGTETVTEETTDVVTETVIEETTVDTTDETKPTDDEYDIFVCGDQRVKGLEGFICDSYYDSIIGAYVEADGRGISEELISMENPPTLYYKPGDKIDFINDPAQSVNCFQLWDKSGDNTIDFGGDLYNYLKANPGQYYLTAELKQGKRYTSMGVKLVVETVMPADFSFSLVWNTFGISSYDSKTGKLIKTKDTSNIKKYTTKYKMTDEELYKIYDILYNRINIDSYPDDYDPYNAPDAEVRLVSTPSRTVIISVTANGTEKTVTCKEISFGTGGCDERATEFLKAVKEITDILTNTDEWQALPDYEFLYD